MRIIAGEFRSRALMAPAGGATRPTMDRAREALFNMLAHRISFPGISVLDLYAGSGAMSFEALSRGAARATLVEKDRNAILAIERNASSLAVEDRIVLVRQDVVQFLSASSAHRFDLVIADPPYDAAVQQKVLALLFQHGWLAADGVCVLEHRSGAELAPVEGAERQRERTVGEASFSIFIHAK